MYVNVSFFFTKHWTVKRWGRWKKKWANRNKQKEFCKLFHFEYYVVDLKICIWIRYKLFVLIFRHRCKFEFLLLFFWSDCYCSIFYRLLKEQKMRVQIIHILSSHFVHCTFDKSTLIIILLYIRKWIWTNIFKLIFFWYLSQGVSKTSLMHWTYTSQTIFQNVEKSLKYFFFIFGMICSIWKYADCWLLTMRIRKFIILFEIEFPLHMRQLCAFIQKTYNKYQYTYNIFLHFL